MEPALFIPTCRGRRQGYFSLCFRIYENKYKLFYVFYCFKKSQDDFIIKAT